MSSYDQWKTASPFDDDNPCEVCGKIVDDCVCHECDVCNSYGDPQCYEDHNMTKTVEQIKSFNDAIKGEEEQAKQEEEWFKQNFNGE